MGRATSSEKPTIMSSCWRRYVWAAAGTLLLLTLLMFNFGVYKLYSVVWGMVRPLAYKDKLTMYDILNSNPVFRNVVAAGKDGGFQKLQQETLGRLFIMSHPIPSHFNDSGSSIGFLGLDVSHSGEASFIYKRILSRRPFPFTHLVVDIGANDGLMSSNSFNFIQWGWDAVLVEPMPSQIKMAMKNSRRFVDPYNDGRQQVNYEQAVISERDGSVDLVITKDLTNMENHLVKDASIKTDLKSGEYKIKVRSLSVTALAKKYHIPKLFGILSIDAEGVGDKVLHQWIELEFRPAYIIYESMHNKEPWFRTDTFLRSVGYIRLAKLGWNHIYELRTQGRQQSV